MVNFQYKDFYGVSDLVEIVRLLRGPGGCPWDGEQTHESIRRNLLEEAYEAAEAIDEKNPEHLREELGDVLLQVVFHAGLEADAGRFDLDGVADGVCKKLIYRHPHVFGETQVSGTGEVLSNWEKLKRAEKGQSTTADSMSAVARSLPALWRAEKVQKKAAKEGWGAQDAHAAAAALERAAEGLSEAVLSGGETAGALGELLFAAVQAGRLTGADPEQALTAETDRFVERCRAEENAAGQN